MARTAVLTKEQIIDAAYTIVNRDSIDALTMRAIAKQLNKSTAPLYTQYDSIEAIYSDLKQNVLNRIFDYTMTKRTNDNFLDIGLGIISFIAENKLISKHFLLSDNVYEKFMKVHRDDFLQTMNQLPIFRILDDNIVVDILDDMAIYTLGLGSLICIEDRPTDLMYYKNKLAKNGEKIVHYHMITSGKYEEIINYIQQMDMNHQSRKEENNETTYS